MLPDVNANMAPHRVRLGLPVGACVDDVRTVLGRRGAEERRVSKHSGEADAHIEMTR